MILCALETAPLALSGAHRRYGRYACAHLARAAQLQAELQQRKVAFDSKMKKAELVAALQHALSK